VRLAALREPDGAVGIVGQGLRALVERLDRLRTEDDAHLRSGLLVAAQHPAAPVAVGPHRVAQQARPRPQAHGEGRAVHLVRIHAEQPQATGGAAEPASSGVPIGEPDPGDVLERRRETGQHHPLDGVHGRGRAPRVHPGRPAR
jgi:hypothetical protein